MIELIEHAAQLGTASPAVIKLLGVGGAGGNTVNSIVQTGNHGIECIVANTDAQALESSKAQHKLQIGLKSTKGLGTGANPEIGKRTPSRGRMVGDAQSIHAGQR